MAGHSLCINYLVLGDEPPRYRISAVTISNEENVINLRKAIKADKQPTYNYISADHLILWKVSIAIDDVLEDTLKSLRFDASDDCVQPLQPNYKLSAVFPGGVDSMSINIIVQVLSDDTSLLGRHASPPSVLQTQVEKLRRAHDVQYPTCAPSLQAVPLQFQSLQTKNSLPFAYCNRPAFASSIPVTLLHPAFGGFVEQCQSYIPTSRDNSFVHELSMAMSGFYASEDLHRDAFVELVKNYYNIQLFPAAIGSGYHTDGHLIAGDYMHFLTESKNELAGDVSEPYFQGCLYYRESIRTRKYVDTFSVLPCFFIYYFGASFGFAGLATTDRPHMDMLGPILPLFCHRHDIAMKQTAARFFGATIKAVRTLERYYEVELPKLRTMHPRSQPNPLFPYRTHYTSLTDLHAIQEFRYTRQYQEGHDSSKLLFFGETVEPSDEGKKLCIKFVRRYGMEAHRLCADEGCAPALYGYETLPGGWYMVIMEELDLKVYDMYCDVDYPEQRCQQVRTKLLACLHTLHGADMVHGDIRDTNLLVGPDESIKLVDFDWAGQAMVVQYPMNVNSVGIKRPETATDGEPVTTEHDREMVDFMIPEIMV